ncbi:MAG: hypothetical protein ACTJLM_03495 [Ehrlichia sp.]
MNVLQRTNAKSVEEGTVYNQTVSTGISGAYGINFLKKDDKIFSVYYVRSGLVENDIICEVQDSNSTYYTKVNDYPISRNVVKGYLPEMLFMKVLGKDFLIVALPEKVGKSGKRNLLLKIYEVHYSTRISLLNTRKMYLTSTDSATTEEVRYPVVLNQDRPGRIVVIARTDHDVRGDTADRLYVMWTLEYRDNEFRIIKPSGNRRGKFNNEYLFKYSGYIGYGKYRDRLIIVSNLDHSLNFLYVGKYFSNYKFFSNIYEISLNYSLNYGVRRCLVNPSYSCDLIDSDKYAIPVSGISAIGVVRNKENTYVAYIGVVHGRSRYNKKQLVIVRSTAGKQLCIYDFLQVREHVSALYVNYVGDSIVMVSVGTGSVVRYQVSELQLRSGNITHVDVMRMQRQQISSVADLVHIVTGDISTASNITYANVTSIRAQTYGNDKIPNFSVYIREVRSQDILRSMRNDASSIDDMMLKHSTTSDASFTSAKPLQSIIPGYFVDDIPRVTISLSDQSRKHVESDINDALNNVTPMLVTSQPLRSFIPMTDVQIYTGGPATKSAGQGYVSDHSARDVPSSSTYSVIQVSSISSSVTRATISPVITTNLVTGRSSSSQSRKYVESDKDGALNNVTSMLVMSKPLRSFIPSYTAAESVTDASVDTIKESTLTSKVDDVPVNHRRRKVKEYSLEVNKDNMKRYVGNTSSVERKFSNGKAKYNVKHTTTKSNVQRRMTMKRHVLRNESLNVSDYMNAAAFNFMTRNVSGFNSSLLTNNSSYVNSTFSADDNSMSKIHTGVFVGSVVIVAVIIMFLKNAFNLVFDCNDVKRRIVSCLGTGRRRLRVPSEPMRVLDLRHGHVRNVNDIQMRTMSYGGV